MGWNEKVEERRIFWLTTVESQGVHFEIKETVGTLEHVISISIEEHRGVHKAEKRIH